MASTTMTSSKPTGPSPVRATKRDPSTSSFATIASPVTVVSGMTAVCARRSRMRLHASGAGSGGSRCTSKSAMPTVCPVAVAHDTCHGQDVTRCC